jgi:hypothetical protein
MADTNHRCHCGGVMDLKARYNSATEQDEVWYVCPFCHAQRPRLVAGLPLQRAEEFETVLTQPTRG